MRAELLLIVFLVGYGNAKSFAIGSALPAEWWLGLPAALVLIAGSLAWARLPERLSAEELGLAGAGGFRAAALGSAFGLVAALVALVPLRVPPLLAEPVRYTPLVEMAPAALALRAFLLAPLDTAVPEELAFRGVLLARLRRTGGLTRAVLVSAVAFTLWHAVIVLATLGQTNVQGNLALLGGVVAFTALFVGGIAFAVLRVWTGHLAAPIAAHATFNATILLGLVLGS